MLHTTQQAPYAPSSATMVAMPTGASFLRSAFASLHGSWRFTRELVQPDAGTVRGSAYFSVCDPPRAVQRYCRVANSPASSCTLTLTAVMSLCKRMFKWRSVVCFCADIACLHYVEGGEWQRGDGTRFPVRGSHEFYYALLQGTQLVVFKQVAGNADIALMYPLVTRSSAIARAPAAATGEAVPLAYPFHAVGHHVCPCTEASLFGHDDLYDGTYEFVDAQHFSLRFAVSGPQKAQDIRTTFVKHDMNESSLLSITSAQ